VCVCVLAADTDIDANREVDIDKKQHGERCLWEAAEGDRLEWKYTTARST
jgi:hypothetical protein